MIAYVKKVRADSALIGIGCVLLATLGLSLKALFIKLVYAVAPQIDAITMLALRFAVALPFFLLVFSVQSQRGIRPALGVQAIFSILLLGGLGFYLSAIFDFSGLAYIPASLERLVLFMYPTFVVLLSLLIRPQEVKRATIMALGMSYLGMIVVFFDQMSVVEANLVKGSALVLAAAVVFAIYTVASVRPIQQYGAVSFTVLAMIAATAITMVHAFSLHGLGIFQQSAMVYAYIIPMALLSTVLPLLLMAEGVKRIGASRASIISSSGPPLTLAMAFVFLGERIGLLQLLGGLLIVGGVWLVARRN